MLIKTVTTKAEAIAWVKSHQIGRRNLTAEELAHLREERRERVVAARERGESTRDIADSEGVSHTTVQQDLKAAAESATTSVGNGFPTDKGANNPAPANGTVTGRDGKEYTANKPKSKRAPKRKPQGFDLKSWEKQLGYVLRGLDDLKRLCEAHEAPECAEWRDCIADGRATLEKVLDVAVEIITALSG